MTVIKYSKGDKVKCKAPGDNNHITLGKTYQVASDFNSNLSSFLCVTGDDDKPHSYQYTRFEAPQAFPTLTAGQRVNLSGGAKGIVVANGSNGLAIKLDISTTSWVGIYFDADSRFEREFNITEVFNAPDAYQAFDYDANNGRVWSSPSLARVAEAEAAVEAAKAALAQAEADLAAASE